MKKYISLVIFFVFFYSSGQDVDRDTAKIKHPVKEENIIIRLDVGNQVSGICNANNVLAIFPSFTVKEEPFSNVKKQEILQKLNTEVKVLHDLPEYTEERQILLIINCKGELLRSSMDNYGRNGGLNKQIEQVFNSYETLKPTRIEGQDVDSGALMYLNIEKGRFTFTPEQ